MCRCISILQASKIESEIWVRCSIDTLVPGIIKNNLHGYNYYINLKIHCNKLTNSDLLEG